MILVVSNECSVDLVIIIHTAPRLYLAEYVSPWDPSGPDESADASPASSGVQTGMRRAGFRRSWWYQSACGVSVLFCVYRDGKYNSIEWKPLNKRTGDEMEDDGWSGDERVDCFSIVEDALTSGVIWRRCNNQRALRRNGSSSCIRCQPSFACWILRTHGLISLPG